MKKSLIFAQKCISVFKEWKKQPKKNKKNKVFSPEKEKKRKKEVLDLFARISTPERCW